MKECQLLAVCKCDGKLDRREEKKRKTNFPAFGNLKNIKTHSGVVAQLVGVV